MYTALVVLSVIVAILLIILVLLQSSKGGGLAGGFGAASNFGTMFGTRRTADFLSTATWTLAAVLTALMLIINIFILPSQMTGSGRESVIQGQQRVPTAPSLPQQQQQAPQQ